MKKVIVILLILTILLAPVQQEAEANPMMGTAVLTNPYVLAAAAVICGAGLVIASSEQLQQDIQNLWGSASDTVASWLVEQVDSGTGRMDLTTAPPEVWTWVQGINVPQTLNEVSVPGWPLMALQFPLSRYPTINEAKEIMDIQGLEFSWVNGRSYPWNYEMVLYVSSTESAESTRDGVDYVKVKAKFYSGENFIKEENRNIPFGYSGAVYGECLLWDLGNEQDVALASTVTRIQVFMTLDPTQGTLQDSVSVNLGGFCFGHYSNTTTDGDAIPYTDNRIIWGENIEQLEDNEVTPKVGNIAIPQTVEQIIGKDVITDSGTTIINIYNQSVPLSTSTPATVVPDPDQLEQGFSFIGTLLRPISSEVSRIRESLKEYASTNTAVDWSPITGLTYSFTNKFPFSLPWDIQRAVSSLTVTQDLPDLQLQFYNPAGGAPIQFTLDWPDFVATFALWVRSAFLIIFGIGLIYATSKLMGGAR